MRGAWAEQVIFLQLTLLPKFPLSAPRQGDPAAVGQFQRPSGRAPSGLRRGPAYRRVRVRGQSLSVVQAEIAAQRVVSSTDLGGMRMSLLDRIVIDPEICHGKPSIRGLRYPVETILELLSSGMTTEEILADYEDLEREDILAALEFALKLSQVKRVVPLVA